jgi:hypothetical protein
VIALLASAAWAGCPVSRTPGGDCQCWCDGPVFLPVPPDQGDVPEDQREGVFVDVFPPPDTVVPTNVQFRIFHDYLHPDWSVNGESVPVVSEGSEGGTTWSARTWRWPPGTGSISGSEAFQRPCSLVPRDTWRAGP